MSTDNPLRNAPSIAGSWSTLDPPLTPWMRDVVDSMGFNQMTPVQASTIPMFMKNKDVVVEAVTGSGKTLAFVIPIIERLIRRDTKLKKNQVGALIISPTRELATQIHAVFQFFLSSQPVPVTSAPSSPSPAPNDPPSRPTTPPPPPPPIYPPALLLISGHSSSPQADLTRFLDTSADIVVGTPGRIEEFILGRGQKVVDVRSLEVLVMDEADRLLDLGFSNTLSRILLHLPKQRRTGLFSATMTEGLSEIMRVGLRNPVRIVVKVEAKATIRKEAEERRVPAKLSNSYMMVHPSEKLLQLVRLLMYERMQGESRFIVYFATCAAVSYFYKILPFLSELSTFKFHSLHGQLPAAKRTLNLHNFSTHPSTAAAPAVLLCTDVAARGLDLPQVDVVIQWDPPVDPKVFAHRVGRTARAGLGGKAVVMLCGRSETEEEKPPAEKVQGAKEGDAEAPPAEEEKSWGREAEYIPFLAVRKIPLKERPFLTASDVVSMDSMDLDTKPGESSFHQRPDPAATDLRHRVQELVLKDRDLSEKGVVAFVSFVRAYSKHEAAYIFRVPDLDLVSVAASYGLVRLPKMPELKGSKRYGWERVEYDNDTYAYAAPQREVHRLEKLKEAAEAGTELTKPARRDKRPRASEAWSEKKVLKEQKTVKREKRAKKKEYLKKVKDGEIAPVEKDASSVSVKDQPVRPASKNTENGSGDEDDGWAELQRERKKAKVAPAGPVSGTFDGL